MASAPLLLSTGGGPVPELGGQVGGGFVGPAAPAAKALQRHPGIVALHVSMLTLYLLLYLLVGSNFLINFVVVALVQAVDFWFVKNVSGRKLIGLRYWNRTTESGDNEWQFECRDADGMAALVPEEKHLFWLTVYLTPVLWVLFAIFSLLKFSLGYLMLCTLGATLGAANVVGFTKSSSEARAELSSRGAGLLSYAASQLWGRGGSSAAAART